MKSTMPPRESEHYSITQFTVSDDDIRLFNLRLMMSGQGSRRMVAGTYTRLNFKGQYDPLMSDTPAEIQDHREFIQRATGHILLNGLGLGFVLEMCMDKPDVIQATVIEIDQELIDLVAPYYHEKYPEQIQVVCADALTYKPPKGVRYGAVWHDIWPSICADNLDDMKVLSRKYGRRTDTQGSWCRWECERQR